MKNNKKTFFIKQWFEVVLNRVAKQTFKRGLILNIALALLVIPSGICSQQHRAPVYQILHFNLIETFSICYKPETKDVDRRKLENPIAVDAELRAAEVDRAVSPYDHYIRRASDAYQVDPALIKAVIMAESSYNPRAVSAQGAKGLMQLMPVTARSLGVAEPFDPAWNIDGGVRYLRQLLDRFEGRVDLAVAAYNAGSRHVRNYGGVPPFAETQSYVKKVLKYKEKYQQELVAKTSGTSV